MAERIRAEVPSYTDIEGVTFDVTCASCIDNLRYVLEYLAGDTRPSGASARATGRARADQGVPYAAVLQAFRIGGRFVWELLVDQADRLPIITATSPLSRRSRIARRTARAGSGR
jgi:hypothetical protein